jgi:hypothetical protein
MPFIAVLEDDPRRVTAIRAAARSRLAEYDVRIFTAAPEMVSWLKMHADDVRAISLDCDLDSTAIVDDRCGSGEDVAAFLVSNPPNCPVLIHSSNAMRAPAMHMELALTGCPKVVLCPFRGSDEWASEIRAALVPLRDAKCYNPPQQ